MFKKDKIGYDLMHSIVFYRNGHDPCGIFSENPFGIPVDRLGEKLIGEGGISAVYGDDDLVAKVTLVSDADELLRHFAGQRRKVSVEYLGDRLLVEDLAIKITDEDRSFLRVAVAEAGILSASNNSGIPHTPTYAGHSFGVVEGRLLSATTMNRAHGEPVSSDMGLRAVSYVLKEVSEYLGATALIDLMHGDLRPENIFHHLDRRKTTILDNGLSQVDPMELHEPERSIIVPRFERLPNEMPFYPTITGLTRVYASPEHARGEDVSPNSDLFAFGLLTIHLTTGNDPARLMLKRLHEDREIDEMSRDEYIGAMWDQRRSFDYDDWAHLGTLLTNQGFGPYMFNATMRLLIPDSRLRTLEQMYVLTHESYEGLKPFWTDQPFLDLSYAKDADDMYTNLHRSVSIGTMRHEQEMRRKTTQMVLEGRFTGIPVVTYFVGNDHYASTILIPTA